MNVQDERFSLSASHPLAFISLLYTFEKASGLLRNVTSNRY